MASSLSSSSLSQERAMAASTCCDIFEAKVVSSLVRGDKRADNKLTPTERARLIRAFFQTWQILIDNLENEHGVMDQLARMQLKDVIYVCETARFLAANVDDAQCQELARLMGDRDRWSEEKCFAKLTNIIAASNNCFEKKGVLRYSRPDFAPLGLWAMFDQWQEDYMEQFEEGYLQRRYTR